jgi:hypothetical protein
MNQIIKTKKKTRTDFPDENDALARYLRGEITTEQYEELKRRFMTAKQNQAAQGKSMDELYYTEDVQTQIR